MNYTNSAVTEILNISIIPDIPKEIHITSDGILPIYPIQWTDHEIPFMLTIGGDCSTFMHYASGDFVVSKILNSLCINLTADTLEGGTFYDSEGLCEGDGGYYKSSFVIPSSAIPEIDDVYEPVVCQPGEYTKITSRRKGANARIYATATVTVNGVEYNVEGQSNPFTVYRFENYHDFRKINEDKIITEILKDYSVKSLEDKTKFFWDTYMYSMFGKDTVYEMNATLYEKIANFNINLNDIDTCEINAIHNHATTFGFEMDKIAINFPSELNRVMNFLSIPHTKIFGEKIKKYDLELNSDRYATYDTDIIGEPLNKKQVINNEQYILYHYKNTTKLSKYYIDSEDLGQKLEDIVGPSLSAMYGNDIELTDFCFYTTIDPIVDEIENSLIDYKNEKNYLTYMDYDTWTEEGGTMEEILNYVLTKNLR